MWGPETFTQEPLTSISQWKKGNCFVHLASQGWPHTNQHPQHSIASSSVTPPFPTASPPGPVTEIWVAQLLLVSQGNPEFTSAAFRGSAPRYLGCIHTFFCRETRKTQTLYLFCAIESHQPELKRLACSKHPELLPVQGTPRICLLQNLLNWLCSQQSLTQREPDSVFSKKTHKSDLQPNHNSKWELNYINL